MHFGFALELPNVDLLNIDLLETHLDFLYTDIHSKYFACLHNVFNTFLRQSSRHLKDMYSRRLQDISSRRLQGMSSRRLQDMSLRRLQDVFSVTIFRLPSRLQDVYKTCWKA